MVIAATSVIQGTSSLATSAQINGVIRSHPSRAPHVSQIYIYKRCEYAVSYSASTIASGRGKGVVRRLHSSRSCARSRHPSGPANSNGSPFRLSAFWRVWPNVIAGRPIGRGLCTQAVNNCLGIRTATSIRATCPAHRNKRL